MRTVARRLGRWQRQPQHARRGLWQKRLLRESRHELLDGANDSGAHRRCGPTGYGIPLVRLARRGRGCRCFGHVDALAFHAHAAGIAARFSPAQRPCGEQRHAQRAPAPRRFIDAGGRAKPVTGRVAQPCGRAARSLSLDRHGAVLCRVRIPRRQIGHLALGQTSPSPEGRCPVKSASLPLTSPIKG